MAGNARVGGLSLGHQRLHDGIDVVKLLARKGDAFPRRGKALRIHPVGRNGIVIILGGDGAFVPGLVTAVADIRSLIDPSALFPFKITAECIASAAGAARDVTEKESLTGIGFPAPEAMDAKVVRVIKTAHVPGI